MAVLGKTLDIITLLLEYNPNLSARDKNGKTPVYYAVFLGKKKCGEMLMNKATEYLDKKLVELTTLTSTHVSSYFGRSIF